MDNNRIERLTLKQRECLRLVLGGYEIKEIALNLGLSPEAVSERLRAARRTLDVSSSREAARALAAYEEADASEAYMRHVNRSESLADLGAAPPFGLSSPPEEAGADDRYRLREPSAAFGPSGRGAIETVLLPPFRTAERPDNDLNLAQRLTVIGVITAVTTTGLSLAVILVILLMQFLIQLSKHGG